MIDQQYYEWLAISVLTLNVVSFTSLIFVIVVYLLRWKQITSFPMRLCLYLCISSLFQSICILIFPPMTVHQAQKQGTSLTDFCIVDSALKIASDLSSIIWTSLIIYSAFASVVYNAKLQRFQPLYLLIGYVLPIAVSIIPIFLHQYGYNVYFCWFDSEDAWTQLELKIGYFFGPLWILFILQVYWSMKTYDKLKKLGLQDRELHIFMKLTLFPLILFAVGFFQTINLIYLYATNQKFVDWLDFISIILLSSHGLFTSMAYGFNPLIQEQILILFGLQTVQRNSTQNQSDLEREDKVDALLGSVIQ